MNRLLKLLDAPANLLVWLALLAGSMMMLHVTIDVAARALLNYPIAGTNEVVSAYYMVAAAFLPWAWIARSNGHISVELFTRKAPPLVNEWLDILVKVLTILYVGVFTWQTGARAIDQIRAGEVWQIPGGFLPIWPSRCLLPLAGGLMVLYLLVRVASDIARTVRR
ncbi:MAG: TRAP transporter small permease [Betaproteobacteria bacterium]|nr:MAG: TRAP transporter small permease [Betaproteobacteria bacterium]